MDSEMHFYLLCMLKIINFNTQMKGLLAGRLALADRLVLDARLALALADHSAMALEVHFRRINRWASSRLTAITIWLWRLRIRLRWLSVWRLRRLWLWLRLLNINKRKISEEVFFISFFSIRKSVWKRKALYPSTVNQNVHPISYIKPPGHFSRWF